MKKIYPFYLFALMLFVIVGCKKKVVLPNITTLSVSNIFANEAISGGVISSQGTGNILARGVVWSTSPNPTISFSTKTTDSSGVGTFSSKLFGLSANTKYYVRAYATVASGTSYGNEVSFITNDIDLKRDLVAYYPFNGNAGDSSGNGNHGTGFGVTYSLDRFNKINSSISLNGINSYVKTIKSGPTGNPQVSVSFWLKTNSQRSGHIISWGDNIKSGNDFRIIVNGNCINAISFDTYNSAVNYSVGCFCNVWDHYAVVYDGSNASNVFSSKLYKNGIFVSSTCFTQNFGATNILATNPITIGTYHGQAVSNFLLGEIDDIRLYSRILKQSEITYLANN